MSKVHHVPYNWDKWFSKRQFTIRQGKDFQCQVHGMASQIRCKASKRGVLVSLRIDGDTIVTTVSANNVIF